MDVSLVMFKSDGTRRDFALTKDRTVVGRTNGCDLRIPLSSVSRQHCEVLVDNGSVRLRDLGSSNGTYHNTVRVQEATLEAGDEIVIGPVVFTIVIDGEPADVKPVRTVLNDVESAAVAGGAAGAAAAKSPPGSDKDDDEVILELDDAELEPVGEDAVVEMFDDHDDDEAEDSSDMDKTLAFDDDADIELIANPADVQAAANKSADRVPQGDDVDDAPQELPLVDDDQELPDVDVELHTPTVDLDDPISALQAMAEAENDESGDLPMLIDDDDDDTDK